jgi:hypothetical protein
MSGALLYIPYHRCLILLPLYYILFSFSTTTSLPPKYAHLSISLFDASNPISLRESIQQGILLNSLYLLFKNAS